MSAYYNEIEPYAAEWLRNLIKQGLIADGEVDERSIVDVRSDDLRGFTQCHFFAGIGVWSYALRLAGWPDDQPVWTGSCPCQPFSAAGKGKGFDDERHLWPEFHRLISECRPPIVFGEQVASKDGLAWLDTVQLDMEATGYAIGAADLCAAGVGAPHIRQRLWFVGERLDYSASARHDGALAGAEGEARDEARDEARVRLSGEGRSIDGLADAHSEDQRGRGVQRPGEGDCQGVGAARERSAGLRADGGLGQADGARSAAWIPEPLEREEGNATQPHDGMHRLPGPGEGQPEPRGVADAQLHEQRGGGRPGCEDQAGHEPRLEPGGCGAAGGLADAMQTGRPERRPVAGDRPASGHSGDSRPRPTNGQWRDADWLHCRDGKWRPVEPGTFPLAHGAPARVGRLCAYGNAIVPQVAAQVIGAYMDARAQ